MKIIRAVLAAVLSIGIAAAASGCSALQGISGGGTLRILSGSENEELEQILEECEKSTGVNIEMTYKGSVDIMQELKNGAPDYDAVWTASSLWISLGDETHIVKHDESICTTPVIFGIKQSVAEELGFTDREVSVKDILAAIESGKLTLEYLTAHPARIYAARQFIDYYQETAAKLLSRYAELEAAGLCTDEVLRQRSDTLEALRTLDRAFSQQFEKLMSSEMTDTDAEIRLLKQTVKMEGIE